MPNVSGFAVPKINPTSYVGDIRLLRPVVVSIERKEDDQQEDEDTEDAEEPKDILGIVSEVCSIVLLVSAGTGIKPSASCCRRYFASRQIPFPPGPSPVPASGGVRLRWKPEMNFCSTVICSLFRRPARPLCRHPAIGAIPGKGGMIRWLQ